MGPKRSALILSPLVSVALLWSQAASAAVSPIPAAVDPLVALSALGTAGSAGAVCGAAQSTSAALAAGQAVAAGAPGGCVLPVPEAAAPPAAPETPPPAPLAAGTGFNVLPLLLGLAAVAAIAAVVLGHHGNGSGNLQPVSPA